MKRQQIIITIFAVLILLTPLAYQSNYLQADESDYYSKIKKGLQYFQKVYDRVQAHYVEEIDPYEFVKAGIEGMLAGLDPYTVFIEQEADTRLRIITTGKYGGVGMEIGMRNDEVTVISPMDNSPAQRAGIQAGDIIKEIGGVNVSGFSLENISRRLRGPVGSDLKLTIIRPGYTGKIMMTMKRTEIVIEDVNFADFVEPGVAYVRLTGFTDKAGIELRQAIRDMQKRQEIEAFILDLRGNTGGLLEAAVEVLGVFLPQETIVVSTKGFRDGEHIFKTHTEPMLLDIPLSVLVDRGSASASEIVAGALQDLDRAIIVGTRTFGKGLVQKVYNIDKNSSTKIKVTTAKYYMPSGRCVQKKDYTEHKAVFYNGDSDSVITIVTDSSMFHTANNREVYEKGGITPDRLLSKEKMPYLVTELWRQSLIFNFAVDYHQNYPDWDAEEGITDEIYQEFISFVKSQGFTYQIEGENELIDFLYSSKESDFPQDIIDSGEKLLHMVNNLKEADIVNHKNKITKILQSELAEKYFGNQEKIRYSLKYDDHLHKAINVVLNETEYKKILAIK